MKVSIVFGLPDDEKTVAKNKKVTENARGHSFEISWNI